MIRILNEEIFMLVERTRLHVHVAGLFYAPVFGPNEIQLVKKKAAEVV